MEGMNRCVGSGCIPQGRIEEPGIGRLASQTVPLLAGIVHYVCLVESSVIW